MARTKQTAKFLKPTSTTEKRDKQFFYKWEKVETQSSTLEIPSSRVFHTTVLDDENIFIYGGKEGKIFNKN
jgi:hypothetical protein